MRTTNTGRTGPRRRAAWLAIAAVPAITATGIATASASAGAPIGDAKAAYGACVQLVQDASANAGTPTPQGLAGRVAKHTAQGWTVVVANRSQAFACNVAPDAAVTSPKPLPAPRLGQLGTDDVAVADNARENREPGQAGEMVWAGGPLPRGVDTVRYTFPDGHVERAVTANGFWVMHYFSPAPFVADGHPITEARRIAVRLSGPAGARTLRLDWLVDTCNQVSHGC